MRVDLDGTTVLLVDVSEAPANLPKLRQVEAFTA